MQQLYALLGASSRRAAARALFRLLHKEYELEAKYAGKV
jgi:hypothetical protein